MKKKSRLRICTLVLLNMIFAVAVQAGGLNDLPRIHEATPSAVRVCPGSSIVAEMNSLRYTQANVSVQNAAGKVLLHRPVVLDPGKNILQFKISEIPQGAYFIQVKSENGTEKMTFVVH